MNIYEDIANQLKEKQNELLNRLEKIHKSKRKSHDRDFSEQAVERENDDVVDALGENILLELGQISNALSRLEKKIYDTCSKCTKKINYERLKALPYTDLCINCSSENQS